MPMNYCCRTPSVLLRLIANKRAERQPVRSSWRLFGFVFESRIYAADDAREACPSLARQDATTSVQNRDV